MTLTIAFTKKKKKADINMNIKVDSGEVSLAGGWSIQFIAQSCNSWFLREITHEGYFESGL